jgi:hypothetical protein
MSALPGQSEHRDEAIEAMSAVDLHKHPGRRNEARLDAIPPAYHLAVVCGPCPTCGGEGEVRVIQMKAGPVNGPCPDCKGTGTLIGGALKEITEGWVDDVVTSHIAARLRERFGSDAPNREEATEC